MTGGHRTLLEFPCDFPLKIMGHAAGDFDTLVIEIVSRHVPGLPAEAVQRRPSREGRYLSLTVTVQAESQRQLDDLYRELSAHPRILMVL